MTASQIIVLATPVFLALIAIEFAWGLARGRNTYRLNDAVNSIGLGMLSQLTAIFTRLLRVGIYTAVYGWVALWHDEAFWTSWYGWLLALLFYDFCYYWLHRAGHESAIFWAAHVVHHQSQAYNLSTALRQTSTGALLGWVFYLPMALAGVPPKVFAVVALIDLLYQFWVHTEHVPKLGWFDRWFVSPSNHRVHHAVNDGYLDRNYGGVLIVWDRLFGSFREEGEKCVYGTRSPLESWDPLWSNGEVYWSLLKDSWHARRWSDKLKVWFKPPGWRPPDVAQRFPRPAFDVASVRVYHPPMTPAAAWFGGSQFVALLGLVALFLWHAEQAPLATSSVWLAGLATVLWCIGAVMQGRIGIFTALLVEAAAMSTVSAALQWTAVHHVFKPLTMVLAIAWVLRRARSAGGLRGFDALLVAGLAFSLVGDVLLMLPGRFIGALVAFLLAHLCYIVLLRDGVGWLPRPKALAVTLGIGAVVYGVLFPGLDPVLKLAVAAYVVVIGTMAAQAIGRAFVLGDKQAVAVAAGAALFMVSDSLLALNKFWQPLPMAQFWVLATYYAAQVLIACNAVAATRDAPATRLATA